MSKSAEAWMPLYVGDYLGDTQRLTTEQHGAYILLILDYWRNGPAPDDDAVLQSITKLDRTAWKRNRPALERLFRIVDGHWTHKRIEREIENAKTNQDRRSSKAQKAAQARWGNSSDGAKGNAPSMPEALPDECPPPSPSPTPNGVCSEADASGAEAPPTPPDDLKPIDLKAAIFAAGVPLLTAGGSTPGAARSMLGKWRRDYGDGAVLDALAAAQAEAVSAPIPWINRTLEARNDRSPHRSQDHRFRPGPRHVDGFTAALREAADRAP
nr:DUF1376 domain-containing protein [Sphingomonas sp. Y57]